MKYMFECSAEPKLGKERRVCAWHHSNEVMEISFRAKANRHKGAYKERENLKVGSLPRLPFPYISIECIREPPCITSALKGDVESAQRQIRKQLQGKGINNRKYFVDVINGYSPCPSNMKEILLY